MDGSINKQEHWGKATVLIPHIYYFHILIINSDEVLYRNKDAIKRRYIIFGRDKILQSGQDRYVYNLL